jgi:hypothetical protein
VQLLHALARITAEFDEPNLVSHAGLVPVMALAGRAGLPGLVAEHVRPGGECGVNAQLKVPALVAGMAAGADSIDDMDVLRHGASTGTPSRARSSAIRRSREIGVGAGLERARRGHQHDDRGAAHDPDLELVPSLRATHSRQAGSASSSCWAVIAPTSTTCSHNLPTTARRPCRSAPLGALCAPNSRSYGSRRALFNGAWRRRCRPASSSLAR